MKKTMKKYSILLGAAFGLFALASCQKEVDVNIPDTDVVKHVPFELSADISKTRTTIDPETWEMDWENGDILYAVTEDEEWGAAYKDDNPGETIADFTYSGGKFATTKTISDGEHVFHFLYTANESQRSYHRGAATSFSLASTQSEDASNPTVALKMNDVLAGKVTATTPTTFANVSMEHLFTLMKVTLKNKTGEDISINKFKISADGANLSGIFNVLFDQNTPYVTLKQSEKSYVIVEITNGAIAAGGELPVYFVMAPVPSFTGDITMTAEDENGIVYSKTNTITNAVSFEAGKYNTANFSLMGNPTVLLTPETLEPFSKDGGVQTISVTTRQFAGTPTITATTDNSVFEASVSEDNVVTVSVASHTTDAETGILTITAAYGTQVVTKTVDLRQESGLSYTDKTFFMESFGGTDSSLGTGSADFASDNEGWAVDNAFLAGTGAHSARFGTSSKKGIATTPSIVVKNNSFDYSGAQLKLTFKAAAWDGSSERTNLKVYATGASLSGSALSNGQISTAKGEWTDYELTISDFTGSSFTLTFEGVVASNARFFLDEVYVYYGSTPKLNPGISFDEEEYTAYIGKAFTAPTLNNPHNLSVTYSSSNTSVAEVNSTTGAVTIKGQTEGATTTITATFAGDNTYEYATASYVLTLATKPAGGTVTFVAGTDVSSTTSITKDGVTISLSSGTLSRSDNYRVYANNTMTISCASNITNIEITTVSATNNNSTQLSTEEGTYTASGTSGSWEGSAQSVVFTAAKQCQMTQIEVTYE